MSFEKILSEAETALDKSTNVAVITLLKQVGASVAVAESVTAGYIANRFLSLETDSVFLSCGLLCVHPSSYVHLCDVAAASVKSGEPAVLSSEMVKGLYKKTRCPVCISSAGVLSSPDNDGYFQAKCTLSFLIQGQFFQKYVLASGEKTEVLSTLSQATFVFLKQLLEVGFNLLPEEETDGRE